MLPYYAPLIGDKLAKVQLNLEWNVDVIEASVIEGLAAVAVTEARVVGVSQLDGNVLRKLYLTTDYRGRGLGRRLIEAVVRQLAVDAGQLVTTHWAVDTRAASFFTREGFVWDSQKGSQWGDPGRDAVFRSRPQAPAASNHYQNAAAA